jgi:transposase-like protein
MEKTKSLYHGHRFPATVISHAVREYFRLQLGLRDIEDCCSSAVSSSVTRRSAAGATNSARVLLIA